jgi:hypothetical protein
VRGVPNRGRDTECEHEDSRAVASLTLESPKGDGAYGTTSRTYFRGGKLERARCPWASPPSAGATLYPHGLPAPARHADERSGDDPRLFAEPVPKWPWPGSGARRSGIPTAPATDDHRCTYGKVSSVNCGRRAAGALDHGVECALTLALKSASIGRSRSARRRSTGPASGGCSPRGVLPVGLD